MRRKYGFGRLRRMWTAGVLLSVMTGMCGCAVGNTAGNEDAVSGSAVRVTDAGVVWEAEDAGEWDMENSTNCYIDLFDVSEEETEGLAQYTKNGKKVREIPFPVQGKEQYYSYYYADDESIVCSITDDFADDGEIMYAIPITKGEDGHDVINPKKKKKLCSTETDLDTDDIYVDSRYIIWFEEGGKYVRYERETGKKVEEFPFGKRLPDTLYLNYTESGAKGIYVFVDEDETGRSEEQALWYQDFDTMQWKKLHDDMELCGLDNWSASQEYIMFCDTEYVEDGEAYRYYNRYYCHDTVNDTFYLVYSDRECEKKLKEEGLIEKEGDGICEIGRYYSRGRLYVEVEIAKLQKKVYQTKWAVASVNLLGKDLRYEKGLSECMWEKGIYKKTKAHVYTEGFHDISEMVWRTNASRVMDIRDGSAFILYETSKSVKCGRYELDTGEFKELTLKETKKAIGFPAEALSWVIELNGDAHGRIVPVAEGFQFEY